MRTQRKSALIVGVAALVMSSCGGDKLSKSSDDETTATVADDAAQAGNEQSDLLVRAYTDDPAKVGLDPIEPPAGAADIPVVATDKYKVDGDPKIAFAIQAPEFSWPLTYNQAVEAHQKSEYPNAELIMADTGLGETDTQVATIEDLLVRDPDVLIVTPLGDIRGPVERASAQDTPVVLCTGTADTEEYVTRVDRDNHLNGAIGAEWIAKQIDYKGNVAMLSGIAGVPTAEERLAAANEVFKKYPDINVVGHKYTNWDAAEGKVAMQALLSQNDQIDAVWADGAGQAVGAIEAFKDAGREVPPFAAEPLNGFLRLASEEGFPFIAVGYQPTHSTQCLDAAMKIADGEHVPKFINIEVPIFDQDSLDEWYRPKCVDDLWLPTPLSDEQLVADKLCEA